VVFLPVTLKPIDETWLFGGRFIEIRLVGDTFDDGYRAAIAFAAERTICFAPSTIHTLSRAGRRWLEPAGALAIDARSTIDRASP